MKRPKLLVSAAQILVDMHSGKMKTRTLGVVEADELGMEEARLTGDGAYTFRRHIELLAEYMVAKRKAEARCT